jgi:tripartite-type tricarboxylate transporter receptor subunit TctC
MFLVSKRLIGKTVIAGALMAALGTGTALAQSYPNKTITLVAPLSGSE